MAPSPVRVFNAPVVAIAAGVVLVGLAVCAALQVVNQRTVHETLCADTGRACRPAAGWLGIDVRIDPSGVPQGLLSKPLQAKASTALIRRDCNGLWMAAFGARIQLDPVALGEHFTSEGLCVDVFRHSVRAGLAGAQVSEGRCVARIDAASLHWGDALAVKITAEVPAVAAAACAALLPQPSDQDPAATPVVQRLALDLRWGLAFGQADKFLEQLSAPNLAAGGWLRRGLALMNTTQELRVTFAEGSATLRIASTPGVGTPQAAPELTLTLGADGGALKLLSEELKESITATRPLTIRWGLDHQEGRVFVNDRPIERLAPSPRPPGPYAVGAVECKPPVPTTALHFVEAGEGGEAISTPQLQAVFQALDEAEAGAGSILSVFVHGWQHSAASGDSYVCDFARLMSAVETMETQAARSSGRPARKVLGVYVGWPGKLYGDDLANTTTFWNRMQTADRLGADGSVLRQLIPGLAQRVKARAADSRADRRSVFVVTGHSMGGRAVFQAVRNGLMQGLQGSQPRPAPPIRAASNPDLVLLVNPAFSAELYRGIHDMESQCQSIGVPLLSFSSKSDGVTRQVYPAGQTVTFDRGALKAAPFPEHIYTAANFGEFVTHQLRLTPVQGEPPRPLGEQSILRGFQRVPVDARDELYRDDPVTVFRQPASGCPEAGDAWYRMHLARVGTKADNCPGSLSKVIEVDARILPDHGTIFTPPFMEYVVRILNRSALSR